MTATFNLTERKDIATRKGNPLYFQIFYKSKAYKLNSRLFVKPGTWKHEAQCVDTRKDSKAAQINNRIKKASIILQEIINSQDEFSLEATKAAYKKFSSDPDRFGDAKEAVKAVELDIERQENAKNEKELTQSWSKEDWVRYKKLTPKGKEFHMLVERVIYDHNHDWSAGYKKAFRSIRTKILLVEPNFDISMLTGKFWKRYVDYCITTLGNVSNTINTDSKRFVALTKELQKEGHTFDAGLSDEMSWEYKEPEILGLSWDKILKLAKADFTDHYSATFEDSRVLFVIGAFTGRRWEEVQGMEKTNFYQRNGEWRYKNIGKGQKSIDIPLLPEAVEFLKRINFRIPKLSGQHVNRDIKLICKALKFNDQIQVITPVSKTHVRKENKFEWETVHFHTARHSYGQHIAELAAGRPHAEKFVSFMLGHASFQTTWKYMNRAASSHDKMFKEITGEDVFKEVVAERPKGKLRVSSRKAA